MNERPVFDIGPVVEAGGTNIGVPAGGRVQQSQPVRERSSSGNGPRSAATLAAVVVLVVVAAVVALFVASADDSATQPEAAQPDALAEQIDEAVADEESDSGSGDGPALGDDTGPPLASFEPPSAGHLRADDVALLFSEQIDTADRQYGIAYVAENDFVVLDDRGITLPEMDVAVSFDTVSNLALLTSGGRTWAINPSNRDESYLVSNSYVVVVSPRPGTVAVITPGDQSQIELMSWALPVPSVVLPPGAELLWVQGRGPLVMPRTGGTFEVTGLATSLQRINDDRAVAASVGGTVYERCNDQLNCAFVSQIGRGPYVELPFSGDVDFGISPDGRWVVAATETGTTVFDVTVGADVMVFEPAETAVDWAPDSSFVAIVAGDMLSIFYPQTQELLPMRLNQSPDMGSLLVFANER